VSRAPAHAKINLALAVGPRRPDGMHEVLTVLQRLELADDIALEPAEALHVEGFPADTLVRDALEALAAAAGTEPRWRVKIEKRIPVAAGLGGGSSDAATALRLANETLREPLPAARVHELARTLGADVPFFLEPGPQLGSGHGADLEPLELPQDYVCLLVRADGTAKESTAAVYARFDESGRAEGFDERRESIRAALAAGDLAALPPNDLASSELSAELTALGAFRADVSGAGPAVYGLFRRAEDAERAARVFEARGRIWIAGPTW
jgi:4-diphosphocytidyl-2-C-methyl-D-erythritol kinase